MSSEAGVETPSPFRYHSLATRTYSLVGLRKRRRWVDDERPVHPVRDVREHGLRAAVVHEDTRVGRLEAERERVAGRYVPEREVRCDPRRVEVDRVRDRAAVRQRHLDGLALPHVEDRPWGAVAVERPGVVLHPGRDLDDHVLQGHVDLHEVARRDRRQRRVVCGVGLRERVGVGARRTGEALDRQALARARAAPRGRDRRLSRCSRAASTAPTSSRAWSAAWTAATAAIASTPTAMPSSRTTTFQTALEPPGPPAGRGVGTVAGWLDIGLSSVCRCQDDGRRRLSREPQRFAADRLRLFRRRSLRRARARRAHSACAPRRGASRRAGGAARRHPGCRGRTSGSPRTRSRDSEGASPP